MKIKLKLLNEIQLRLIFSVGILLSLIFPGMLRAERKESLQFLLHPPSKTAKKKFESEHHAVPVREYWLNALDLNQPKGFLLYPDKTRKDAKLIRAAKGWKASFPSPWDFDPQHGPNNVYVVDQKVEGDLLDIRAAKWITIHHSCAWGHNYKHNEERQTPAFLSEVPLEIVPPPLWDGNFHVNTRTGDIIELKILSYGKPVENARITIISDLEWKKEMRSDKNGSVRFQLIRDYYPQGWENFNRHKIGSLLFVAEYEIDKQGDYDGKKYARIKLTSTLPWRYQPATADYSSYSSGLATAGVFFVFTAAGIFLYREKRKKPLKEAFFDEKN